MELLQSIAYGGLAVSGGSAAYFARALYGQVREDFRPFAFGNTDANLILGRGPKEPVLFTGQEMGVTIGSTGSGKFVAAIAPNLLAYPGSCFVIDPKGEACAVTAHARATDLKQKVYRLDPFDATNLAPGSTLIDRAAFNPLDALDASQDTVVSDAGSLASAIILPATANADPFWKNSAKELLTALILFTLTNPAADGKRNLSTVLGYLSASPEGWDELFVALEASSFTAVRNCSTAMRAMSDKTFSGVVQQARSELGFAIFPEIERVTGTSSFALSDLFTESVTVYLVLPAERLESHSQWLRLMVAASLMAAGRFKRSQMSVPVLWIIDEAARLGTLEEIPKAYGLMRGYGVRVWSFWQDLGQMKACYPNHWSSLIGNSFNQVLAVGDFDSAEYFGKMAGTAEVMKVSQTSSRNDSANSTASFGQSKTYSTQREAVIAPEKLLHMPSERCYLRLPGQPPVFVDKLRYFDVPQLNERAMANPYHSRF